MNNSNMVKSNDSFILGVDVTPGWFMSALLFSHDIKVKSKDGEQVMFAKTKSGWVELIKGERVYKK